MTIEELNLVSTNSIMKGGSTMPLLITAENSKGIISPYVLKLYKQKNVFQNYSVAKEILAIECAKEFDLPVVEYGVINFDHKLLEPYYNSDYIRLIDNGYKFCSKLIPGVVSYNSNVNNAFMKDYELGNVFAFDNLLISSDRGGHRNKSNLLIKDEEFYLIDHEQTLHFYSDPSISSDINFKRSFSVYDYRKHIFYMLLKKSRIKNNLFDDFQQSLYTFDLKIFDSIFAELDKFNISNRDKYICIDYIKWAKSNLDFVIKTLNDRIQ